MKKGAQRRLADSSDAEPIFVHSSWRVASTWFWERFRRDPKYLAYYEIFNERLADISKEWAATRGPGDWPSGHSAGAPYFLEFLPLIRDSGGVIEYDASMAFKKFIPREGLLGCLSEEERSYVNALLHHAHNLGKRAVLTDTRTLGRIHALKSEFAGIHIVLVRNLFHQWASFSSQAERGQPYFIKTIKDLLDENLHDPFFHDVRRLYALNEVDVRGVNWLYAFLLLHLYLYAAAVDHADIIVDVTRVAGDQTYRRKVERKLQEKANAKVALGGALRKFEYSLLILEGTENLRQVLDQGINLIKSHLEPSDKAVSFVERMILELNREIEQYECYAGALVRVVSRPGGLLDSREKLQRASDDLLAAKSALVTAQVECASANQRQEGTKAQLEEGVKETNWLRGERVALSQRLLQTTEERERAIKESEGLRVRCNGLEQRLETLAIEKEEAVADGRELKQGLNEVRNDLAQATTALEHARREASSLARERDSAVEGANDFRLKCDKFREQINEAVMQRDEYRTKHEILQTRLTQLAASRDGVLAERDMLVHERSELGKRLEKIAFERDAIGIERRKLEEESKELRKLLAETSSSDEKARLQLVEIAAERDGIINEVNRLRLDCARLREEVEEVGLQNGEAKARQRNSDERLAQLVKSRGVVVAERDMLVRERHALEQQLAEKTAERNKVDIYRRELEDEKEKLRSGLARMLMQFEVAAGEVRQVTRERDDLGARLDDAKREAEVVAQRLSQETSGILELKELVANVLHERDFLTAERDAGKREVERLVEQLSHADRSIIELNLRRGEQERRLAELSEHVEAADADNEALREELENLANDRDATILERNRFQALAVKEPGRNLVPVPDRARSARFIAAIARMFGIDLGKV
jgi:chromosome segregation ATPase